MRVLGLLLCFSNNAESKGIKQQMLENRLKFDRDIIAHGDSETEWDYDDWDPYLDLEDEELEALLRKMHSHMDHDDDGFVNEEELIGEQSLVCKVLKHSFSLVAGRNLQYQRS